RRRWWLRRRAPHRPRQEPRLPAWHTQSARRPAQRRGAGWSLSFLGFHLKLVEWLAFGTSRLTSSCRMHPPHGCTPDSIPAQTAAAPPTISEISWVIAAWRALL